MGGKNIVFEFIKERAEWADLEKNGDNLEIFASTSINKLDPKTGAPERISWASNKLAYDKVEEKLGKIDGPMEDID